MCALRGAADLDGRVEVAQRGHQFLGIGAGQGQQAVELLVTQVGHIPVTLQVEVTQKQLLDFVAGMNFQLKRRGGRFGEVTLRC